MSDTFNDKIQELKYQTKKSLEEATKEDKSIDFSHNQKLILSYLESLPSRVYNAKKNEERYLRICSLVNNNKNNEIINSLIVHLKDFEFSVFTTVHREYTSLYIVIS